MKALKYFLLSAAIVLVALGSSTSAWAEEVVQNISGDLILTGSYTAKDGGYFDRDEQGSITRVSMGNGFAEIAIRSLQDPQGVVKDMREFNLVPTVNGIEYPYMILVNKDGSGASLYCPYTVYGTFNLKATYKKDPQRVYNFSFKIVQESMLGIRYFFHFEDENGEAIKIIPQYHYDRLKNLYVLTLPKGIAPQDKNSSLKGWIINNKIYQSGDVVAVPANNFNGAIVIVKPSISHKGTWKLYGNGRWAHYYDNNTYARDGFKLINNKTYHFDKSGWMSTGWVFDKGNWYLMAQSGEMLFGWQKLHGLWYYLDKQTGKMAANTSIDGYKLNHNGAWVA